MNILVLTGQLYPIRGNNTNLIMKLLPTLSKEHTVCLAGPVSNSESQPEFIEGYQVYGFVDDRSDFARKFLYPLIAKLADPHGYSDAIQTLLIGSSLKELRKRFPFDAVISTMEPFPSGCAAMMLPRGIKRILYLMDPPQCICNQDAETYFRRRMLPKVLSGHDLILTTPFIRKALCSCGYEKHDHKFAEVGFPMIGLHDRQRTPDDIVMDKTKINLLFCGWLYSDIRSPKYFIDIVSRLDDRFCIYFMGKECELLRERFSFETKAQVITLPQQPYRVALNAMADADILINIGNSIPVHMPSKTLEYINTGKPIVNFHKLSDCPTLYYTRRYPLCLNLWEGNHDTEQTTQAFIRFCTENKGKSADTAWLADQFPECTPQYIAQIIMDEIGAKYE